MLVGKQKEQHIHSRNSIIRKTSVFFRNHFRNSLRIIPALAFSFCTMLPVVLPSQNTWQKETLLLMNKAAAKTLEPSRILWLKNPETAGAVAAFSTENKIVNKNSEIIPVDMHVRKISLPSTGNTTLDFLISCTAVVVGIMVGGAVLALIVPFLLSLLVMTDDIHIFPKRKITSYGPSYLVFMAKAPVGFNTWDGKLTGTAKGELLFCLQVKSFNAWDGKIEKTVKNYARNTQKTYKINLTSQEKLALIAKPFFAIVKDANGTKYMIIREYHDSLNVYACKENKTIDLDIYYLIDKSVRAGIFALKDGESYEIRPSKISREIRELISRGSYGTCICFVKKDGNQLFILGYVIPAPSSGGNIPSFSEPCFLAGTPISTPRGAIPIEKIAKDSDRNFWMSGQDAMAYGLVGRVIQSIEEL